MNLKQFSLIVLMVGVLALAPIPIVLAQDPNTVWITSGVYPRGTWTIWQVGSTYYCKNQYGYLPSWSESTNITILTQNAHNALEASGGHIHFCDLTAEIAQVNISKDNVTITGEGWGTFLYPSTGTNAIFYVSGENFIMHHMHLFGYNEGIRVTGAHGVILTSTADYPHIYNCMINRFDHSPIQIDSGCNLAFIHDNYLSCWGNTNPDSACLRIGSSADCNIQNNQIGGGYWTVFTSSARYLIFIGNKVFGAVHSHLYLAGMGDSIIDGNIVGGGYPNPTHYNLWLHNYASEYGCDNIISNNNFYHSGGGTDCIRLEGDEVKDNLITGNFISDIPQNGIKEHVGTEDYNFITGNYFHNVTTPLSLQGANSQATNNYGAGAYP